MSNNLTSVITRVGIGIDLGATKTMFGIISDSGQVLHTETIKTLSDAGGLQVAQATAEQTLRMVELARTQNFEVVGVGVGSAGVIGADGEIVTAANAMADWSGTPLAAVLHELTGLPVAVVNDVWAHALGEAWLGASQHAETSLMVAFGTGVGGCFLQDGAPLTGAHRLAGHVGHFSSPYAVDVPCPCGGLGHVEAVAAGPAIFRKFLELGGEGASDTKDVARRAISGDGIAREAISFAGRAAGVALGDLANILDPHLIIVSGGLINLGNDWWTALLDGFEDSALGGAKRTPLTAALLGKNAAILGAVSIAPGLIG